MHYTGQRMFGMVLHYLTLSIHLTIKSTLFGSVQLFRDMWRLITASPSMCLLGNLHDLSMQMNTVHVALTTLCIAMKTVLVNWKNEKSQHIRSAWGQVGVSLRLWFGVYTGDHGWNQCLNESPLDAIQCAHPKTPPMCTCCENVHDEHREGGPPIHLSDTPAPPRPCMCGGRREAIGDGEERTRGTQNKPVHLC